MEAVTDCTVFEAPFEDGVVVDVVDEEAAIVVGADEEVEDVEVEEEEEELAAELSLSPESLLPSEYPGARGNWLRENLSLDVWQQSLLESMELSGKASGRFASQQ